MQQRREVGKWFGLRGARRRLGGGSQRLGVQCGAVEAGKRIDQQHQAFERQRGWVDTGGKRVGGVVVIGQQQRLVLVGNLAGRDVDSFDIFLDSATDRLTPQVWTIFATMRPRTRQPSVPCGAMKPARLRRSTVSTFR